MRYLLLVLGFVIVGCDTDTRTHHDSPSIATSSTDAIEAACGNEPIYAIAPHAYGYPSNGATDGWMIICYADRSKVIWVKDPSFN